MAIRVSHLLEFPKAVDSKRSQDPLHLNEIDINNSSHSSFENVQMPIHKHTVKMASDTYFYNLPTAEYKMFTNAWTHAPVEHQDFTESILLRLSNKLLADTSIANGGLAADAVSVSSKPIKESSEPTEITEFVFDKILL